MDSQHVELHMVFFPYMAPGHMIPMLDLARLLASRGVKATIVTTPFNAPFFSKTIQRDRELGIQISIRIINFPCAEAGLPRGCENSASITSQETMLKFLCATSLFQQPLAEVLQECQPDCLVADVTFPWATQLAGKLGIPRLYFNGSGFFAMCVSDCVRRYEPQKAVKSDSEPFTLPGLPDQIKITKLQLPDYFRKNPDNEGFNKLVEQIWDSDLHSHRALVNSFHELEPAYSEHYQMIMGRKAWHIGPLSLFNRAASSAIEEEHECLKWLDSKEPNSVLYICFGSLFRFSDPQLLEIAMALEASGQNFIWVVKREAEEEDQEIEKWLPLGFEKRIEGKGLIIRGWAPQILIIEHEAIGGFMTHCGWNSTLEAVSGGVPMVTWPLFAEQFYNEKLITDVLRIGVGVGAQQWCRFDDKKILIKKEQIENAVSMVMVGEEAQERRKRAVALKEMAKKATEEGGSSYSNIVALLEELKALKINKQQS